MCASEAKVGILRLLEPDDNPDYIRVKQATKQGYIECIRGGWQISVIPQVPLGEVGCNVWVRLVQQ